MRQITFNKAKHVCECHIHLRNIPDVPCSGHGEGCPCMQILANRKK